jgi:hypothetical protein
MPPRNTPAQPDTPDTPDTPDATPNDDVTMREGEHNPFANALLAHAQSLADERDNLVTRIAANRDTLRNLRTQKLMSDEQAAAVEAFYPTRTRKTKTDDNGATPADAPAPAST